MTDVRQLWAHEREAVEAAVPELKVSGRATVVMACGTGKTLTCAEVTRRLAPTGRVLIVVPTLDLAAQTIDAYRWYLGDDVGRIGAVCSEHRSSSRADRESFELALDQNRVLGNSTDPTEVARWLRQRSSRITVVCTYHSLPVIAEAHRRRGTPGWGQVIVDEAHRSAGRTGRKWGFIHDDDLIRAKRRLYVTATPRIADDGAENVISMDDESVYGPQVYRLGFGDAIRAGLLSDYRVVVTAMRRSEVHQLSEDAAVSAPSGQTVPLRMLLAQIATLKAAKQFGVRRVIAFTQRVDEAERFSAKRGLWTGERFDRTPARLLVTSFDNCASVTIRCMPGFDRPDQPWFLLARSDQPPAWIGPAGDLNHAIQTVEKTLALQRT